MSWRATDLSENEAKQQAADMNVVYNQYGQRNEKDRREVKPPVAVESATWTGAGGSSTTGSKIGTSGGVASGDQTDTTCGSRRLIFGRPKKQADRGRSPDH
jgi:hypothetical protein